MDFTYYVAGILAVVVAAIASAVFLIRRGRSIWRLWLVSLVVALVVNGLLLINWSQVGAAPAVVLLSDLLFIPAYSAIGVVLGTAPLLLLRKLWRAVRNSKEADS